MELTNTDARDADKGRQDLERYERIVKHYEDIPFDLSIENQVYLMEIERGLLDLYGDIDHKIKNEEEFSFKLFLT